MSDPTLTAGADASYREALLEKLGEADPVHELSALFERLPAALSGLTEDQLRESEGPGKWSILQVVQHMADVELVQGMRIRRILVEDHPELVAMDQDAWAERLWPDDADLEDALDTLRALRLANLRLVTHLSPDDLARDAQHPERGVETLETLLKL
ncbi:MAG: DinB family protein, partial [Gemmatimonadota bacterium]|nr:DinB family protein [Gemmatimonadota bacterium]